MNKTEIFDDALEIVRQIKAIDSGYRVFRNHIKHAFEVCKEYGMKLHTELLYSGNLDERFLRKVWATRKENAEKLLKEMEISNKNLEKHEKEQLFDKIMQNVKL